MHLGDRKKQQDVVCENSRKVKDVTDCFVLLFHLTSKQNESPVPPSRVSLVLNLINVQFFASTRQPFPPAFRRSDDGHRSSWDTSQKYCCRAWSISADVFIIYFLLINRFAFILCKFITIFQNRPWNTQWHLNSISHHMTFPFIH